MIQFLWKNHRSFYMKILDDIQSFFAEKFGKQKGHVHRGSHEFDEKKFISKINRKEKKPLGTKSLIIRIGLIIVGLIVLGAAALTGLVAYYSVGLPDVNSLYSLSVPQSTIIYDRNGNVIYAGYGGQNRQYIAYDQISSNLINATVAIEDRNFWQHSGFDIGRIFSAGIHDVLHPSDTQGASTIDEQYIKNTFLSDEKTIGRKIQELILAVQLDQAFSKQKIMELYVNKIAYGKKAYGVETASQMYFSVHAKDLDVAQSAILAAIPNAPSFYDPYGQYKYSQLTKEFTPDELASRNIQSANDLQSNEFVEGLIGTNVQLPNGKSIYIPGRSDLVLQNMQNQGYITADQASAALTEMHQAGFIKPYQDIFKHPHFVEYILSLLQQQYGQDVVQYGGLNIYTTLDPNLQNIAEQVVKTGALSNEKKYNDKNAALVAIDPKTGQILAMVGSRDYNDASVDGNVNVALSYRQPGSSFKPIVYSQLFENQYGPGTVIFDAPIKIGPDTPKNFDGKFWGPMTIRKALGQSRNIPAIKAYFLAGGQQPIIALAEKMGIQFQELQTDPNHAYSYPLAIGAAGIRLLDMVSAYSVFADGGIRHAPTAILKVTNSKGDVLPLPQQWQQDPGSQVLDPQIAYLITNILSDTTVRLAQTMSVPGQVVASKSGTSNGYIMKNGQKIYFPNDLLTFGYTTGLVAGVWTGNNNPATDGTISLAADGVNTAAPIWKAFMTQALQNIPSQDFPVPPGIKQVQISKASGLLPSPLTPADQITTDVFASFSVPTSVDNSFQQVNIDTLCGKLANEFTPQAMTKQVTYENQQDIGSNPNWQQGADGWIQQNMGQLADPNDPSVVIGPPPTESCPGRTAQNYANKPTVNILSPANGSMEQIGSKVPVQITATAPAGIDHVEFDLDNNLQYRTAVAPYNGIVRLPITDTPGTQHQITVNVFDQSGFVGSSTINITVGSSGAGTSGPLPPSSNPGPMNGGQSITPTQSGSF